ncbi:MAG: TIGR04282 family arsenosugar biosynthesis glycosyltransferase [Deltaproteobacteria bacterium]|nr:TIGR04282 family arsenosugar biosynthesis glycosyltransferase [Deltaproteobacteria bacterium]
MNMHSERPASGLTRGQASESDIDTPLHVEDSRGKAAGSFNKDALAIMLKAPVPGNVKTRLSPPLTQEEAAQLYRCFIEDVFIKAAGLKGVDLYAFCAPEGGGADALAGVVSPGVSTFPQEGEDLGARMRNVFKSLFDKGHKKVSIIGTDSPDMPVEYIRSAFTLLDEASLVLGPAKDGGYYLIAMNSLFETVFDGISWSTGAVLEQTIEKAKQASIAFKLLPLWHDIDTYEDLALLRGSVDAPVSSKYLEATSKNSSFS